MADNLSDQGTHWVDSGSGPGYEVRNRPEYSPAILVMNVQRLLSDHGIRIERDFGMNSTATIAAADLLRALGVRPVIVPERNMPPC
jgi:hypothetical protein